MPTHDPSLLMWILGFAALSSILSLAAGAGYLLLPARLREHTVAHLISFATGTLLGVTFMDLLPEALQAQAQDGPDGVMTTVLAGIFVFFVLEKALIWRHAHHVDGHGHAMHHVKPAGPLVLVGDTFHNFLDGVLLTAVFVSDFQLGVLAGLAMIAHEIPQELGDFAIMLHSGFSRARTFLWNGLSSLAMVLGALLAWWQLPLLERYLPHVIAFTAASFIYIAVADLIPSLHRGVKLRETLAQVTLIVAGIALIGLLHGH
ncbi:MAG TPA: ZIP family metal transporter [Gammaproteobacteria bacterium]|mgnify:CR=1 FL=1|nr:ZIP family metal transporter [Gammaproteobacteria bacterium]